MTERSRPYLLADDAGLDIREHTRLLIPRYGGWVMPYHDEVFGDAMDDLMKAAFDLLLGEL